jgi:hypothetical protein
MECIDPSRLDHVLRARARRAEEARQALKAPLQGRTLATAPSAELDLEELRERMAASGPAFEGL